MAEKTVRTRYAPSPTGFMHVGNLRTALYEYLVAKSQNGKFVLRIEDTDRERLVEGAVDVIYDTMKLAGLKHDEGPDIGGDFGPYVQSERKDMYLPYAEQLIKEGKAYRCFCTKERLEKLQDSVGGGYDRHCRNLPQAEIDRLLAEGTRTAQLRDKINRRLGAFLCGCQARFALRPQIAIGRCKGLRERSEGVDQRLVSHLGSAKTLNSIECGCHRGDKLLLSGRILISERCTEGREDRSPQSARGASRTIRPGITRGSERG